MIVFESKSIIPSVMMRCVFDPVELEKILRQSFLHGVEQGQETVFKLSRADKFSSSCARIVVVTLGDFYIYGGEYISDYLNQSLEGKFVEKYGALPVPMSNVLFMTLRDLNILTEWLRDKPANAIFDFFDELERKQKEVGGMRFSVSQHLDEQIFEQVMGGVGVLEALNQCAEEVGHLLQQNIAIRSKQSVPDFIVAFGQFQLRLRNAFS